MSAEPGKVASGILLDATLRALLLLLLTVLIAGCTVVKTAVDVPVRAVTPSKKNEQGVDPVEIQQKLLRFSDEFLTRMVLGIDKLQRGTNSLGRAEALQWKIAFATETTSIASGPNSIASLLDMTAFVTVTRMSLEDLWQPKFFGNSAAGMMEGCRNSEKEIWLITDSVLKPEQAQELRKAIETWHKQNPFPENILAARSVGFAAQVAKLNQNGPAKSDSVFNLLMLDPLAGLDPAVREIAQTRLFAERALYVAQKMPLTIRWQTELLSVNALELPAIQTLVTNSTQIAQSTERFAAVAEKLPAQINDVRQTLQDGTRMSDSLNTTLQTFDALMKRFGVGETNKDTESPKTNAEPFRILDYAQTATQLEATARQLNDLLVTLDRTLGSSNLTGLSAQFAPAVQQAQTGGKEVIDYAFRKGLILVGVLLIAALIYRFISSRLANNTRSGGKSS